MTFAAIKRQYYRLFNIYACSWRVKKITDYSWIIIATNTWGLFYTKPFFSWESLQPQSWNICTEHFCLTILYRFDTGFFLQIIVCKSPLYLCDVCKKIDKEKIGDFLMHKIYHHVFRIRIKSTLWVFVLRGGNGYWWWLLIHKLMFK